MSYPKTFTLISNIIAIIHVCIIDKKDEILNYLKICHNNILNPEFMTNIEWIINGNTDPTFQIYKEYKLPTKLKIPFYIDTSNDMRLDKYINYLEKKYKHKIDAYDI